MFDSDNVRCEGCDVDENGVLDGDAGPISTVDQNQLIGQVEVAEEAISKIDARGLLEVENWSVSDLVV